MGLEGGKLFREWGFLVFLMLSLFLLKSSFLNEFKNAKAEMAATDKLRLLLFLLPEEVGVSKGVSCLEN